MTVLVILFAAPALGAGPYNTPHDLASGMICAFCHVPHIADGPWLVADMSGLPAYRAEYGIICSTCHSPGGGAVVNAEISSPFPDLNPDTHGVGMKGMAGIDQTLPDVAEDGGMQCTTCHSVHDNAKPPFLVDAADRLCPRCHADKVDSAGGGASQATAPGKSANSPTPCTSCHAAHPSGRGGRALLLDPSSGDRPIHRPAQAPR